MFKKLFDFVLYKKIVCPLCDGDGLGRCNNPDHGFIKSVGGELSRLGCPCCGHDENHIMKNDICDICNGTGIYKYYRWRKFDRDTFLHLNNYDQFI